LRAEPSLSNDAEIEAAFAGLPRLSERATGPNKTELLYGIPANSGGRLACYTFGTMNAQIER
jgi:hypothetical protein